MIRSESLSSPCSGESSTEAGDYGYLEHAAHVCTTASPQPAKRENKTSLYVNAEPLCMHAQVLLKVRETSVQGHTGKSETRRNITRFTWENRSEHESRAWEQSMNTSHCLWVLCGWIISVRETQWSRGNINYHTSETAVHGFSYSSMIISSSTSLTSDYFLSPHSSPEAASQKLLPAFFLCSHSFRLS